MGGRMFVKFPKKETNQGISDTSIESSQATKGNEDKNKEDIASVPLETEEISFGL